MSASIKNIAETAQVLPTFGESVDAILQRELKYVQPKPREVTNGEFVGVLNYNTDWIKFVDERAVVQYALLAFMQAHGKLGADGRPEMFQPIIVPFHANADGTPLSQLRVFFYRQASEPGARMNPSTLMVRCEPFGTQVKFDVEQQLAKQIA